ncbi:pathogen-related protein-like [Typha angustifolia]|uniref:pathogen-related protein-like n=1 Tax=Typha angustifolia TaxID=59011 RepID=UPI003C2EEE00
MDSIMGDEYRSHLVGEGEANTQWRHGSPPTYHVVNRLFESERIKEWPKGSLEEMVQNAIKTWEMELSHKTRIGDFKSINPAKFKYSVNGRKGLTGEEVLTLGSYNALLQSSLPPELRGYDADAESFESSHDVFRSAFPRGFAWEVVNVYSGPPVITFKFRHWGHMEGTFKGHEATGEMVEFYGVTILKVDEQLKAEEVEIYYDPGELLGGLLKGPRLSSNREACPYFKSEYIV